MALNSLRGISRSLRPSAERIRWLDLALLRSGWVMLVGACGAESEEGV